MATQNELELAVAAQDQSRDASVTRAKAAHAAGSDGTYTVQPGDTFESIAEAVYGDADAAERLWQANAGAVGSNPGSLTAGTSIVLPAP